MNILRFIRKNWIITLIFIIGFLLRVFPLTNAFYWDEAVYLQNAEAMFSGQDNYNEFDMRPPVLPIAIATSYLFSHTFFMAKVIAAILAALTIVGIYLVGREFSEKTGLIAAGIYALLPFAMYQGRLIMTDNPSLFFSSMAVYFSLVYLRKENKTYIVLSSLFVALAVLTRFLSIIIIPVIGLTYLYAKRKTFFKNYKKTLVDIAYYFFFSFVFTFPYFFWSKLNFGGFFYPLFNAFKIVSWGEVQGPFYYFTIIDMAIPIGIVLLSLMGMFVMLSKHEKNPASIAVPLWAIISFGYISTVIHKEVRYLTTVLPPFLISASFCGSFFIDEFKKKKNKKIVAVGVASVIILVLSLSLHLDDYNDIVTKDARKTRDYFINDYNTTTMKVGYYLKENLPPGYIIYSNYDYPTLALYSERKVELVDSGFPLNAKISYVVVYNLTNWISLDKDMVAERYPFVTEIDGVKIYRID